MSHLRQPPNVSPLDTERLLKYLQTIIHVCRIGIEQTEEPSTSANYTMIIEDSQAAIEEIEKFNDKYNAVKRWAVEEAKAVDALIKDTAVYEGHVHTLQENMLNLEQELQQLRQGNIALQTYLKQLKYETFYCVEYAFVSSL